MPGFNRKGPDNMGSMTGKRQGRCISDNARFEQGQGTGFGRRSGSSTQFGRNRGCGRGFGLGNRKVSSAPANGSVPTTKAQLSRHAEALTQELKTVKDKLKSLSGK